MLPCFLSFALLWNPLLLPWQLLTLSISGCLHQGEKVYNFPALICSYFFPADQILKSLCSCCCRWCCWSQPTCAMWAQALCRALPAGLAPLHLTAHSVFPPSPSSVCHPISSQLLVLIHYQMLCCWQHRTFPAFTEFSGVMTKGIPVHPDRSWL